MRPRHFKPTGTEGRPVETAVFAGAQPVALGFAAGLLWLWAARRSREKRAQLRASQGRARGPPGARANIADVGEGSLLEDHRQRPVAAQWAALQLSRGDPSPLNHNLSSRAARCAASGRCGAWPRAPPVDGCDTGGCGPSEEGGGDPLNYRETL